MMVKKGEQWEDEMGKGSSRGRQGLPGGGGFEVGADQDIGGLIQSLRAANLNLRGYC